MMAPRVVHSPLAGRVIDLGEVDDDVFADRIMGDGAALTPDRRVPRAPVVAPVAGTIAKLFKGGHGVAIETADGVQVLVHVGIDTVELHGDGFTVHAAEGETVEVGTPLVEVDLARLAQLEKDATTPVVVISGHPVRVLASGAVAAGDPLLEILDPE